MQKSGRSTSVERKGMKEDLGRQRMRMDARMCGNDNGGSEILGAFHLKSNVRSNQVHLRFCLHTFAMKSSVDSTKRHHLSHETSKDTNCT